MIEQSIRLKNKLGLHARAASKLLDITSQFTCDISIVYGDKQADGKSIMSVMLLAAPFDSELTFTVDGRDEKAALNAITRLIDDRFGEEQ